MSASQPRADVSQMQETLQDTMPRLVPREPSVWRRVVRSLTKGEILIMAANGGQDYAQRWPAPAILSAVISAAAILVMVVFSLFNNFSSSKREDSQTLTETRERIIVLEGDKRLLQSEVERLKQDGDKYERDINTLKLALGLDISDGVRNDKTPKGK